MDLHALPDGRTVTIRPIRPDDSERLQLTHEHLSDQSRYRRFMTAKPVLTDSDAAYLANIDGCDHYALAATIPAPEGEAIIGVARYIRLPRHPEIAEFAIVVADAWQGQGLARELLGRLADAAVTRGVQRFAATIFSDNMAIRHMIDRLAAGPVIRHREGNVLEVEFPLPTRRPELVITRGETERGAPAKIAACAGS